MQISATPKATPNMQPSICPAFHLSSLSDGAALKDELYCEVSWMFECLPPFHTISIVRIPEVMAK